MIILSNNISTSFFNFKVCDNVWSARSIYIATKSTFLDSTFFCKLNMLNTFFFDILSNCHYLSPIFFLSIMLTGGNYNIKVSVTN